MSNYGNSDQNDPLRRPNDPLRREPAYDSNAKAMNATWGWIAAAVFLVIVLAVGFGISHQPGTTNTASNDSTPPTIQHMTPPAAPAPGPTNITPAAPAPITPAPTPSAPAPNGQ